MQPPVLETVPDRHLAGMKIETCIAEGRAGELWGSFMPRRFELTNKESEHLFNVNVYSLDFDPYQFTPLTRFTQWAAMEVSQGSKAPVSMFSMVLKGGVYAVFIHKGPAADFPQTVTYIYEDWMPGSGYRYDNQRPSFEIMDETYKGPLHQDSEEKVYIPVVAV